MLLGEVGPGHDHGQHRTLGERLRQRRDLLDARGVGPVYVLEHDDRGARARPAVHVRVEGVLHGGPARDRIVLRREHAGRAPVAEIDVEQQAEEWGPRLLEGAERVEPSAQQLEDPRGLDGRAIEGEGRHHEAAHEPERRLRSSRLGSGHDEPDLGVSALRGSGELGEEPRLPGPWSRGDQHCAPHAVVRGLGERAREQRQLAITPDARRGLPEEQVGLLARLLADQDEGLALAPDLERRTQEAARQLVDPDLRRGVRQEERRAVEHGPRWAARGALGRPGGDGDREAVALRDEVEGGSRRELGLIGRASTALQRERSAHGPERHDLAAELLRRALELGEDLCGVVERQGRVGRRAGRPQVREHDAVEALLCAGRQRRPMGRGRRDARRADDRGHREQLRERQAGVGGAPLWISAHQAGGELVERRGDRGAELADARRVPDEQLREDRERRGPLEGRPSCQAFEQQAAEREDVGARRRRGARRLLRGHVAGRPQHRSGAGQRAGPALLAGDAEVEQLRVLGAAAHEEDVAGLHVTVHHPAGVRVRQRLEHALPDGQRLLGGEAALHEAALQVLALQPLHGQERGPVGGLPVPEVTDDARMIEGPQHARFALEALAVDVGAAHDLQRDERTTLDVSGSEDVTHAPAARGLLDHEALVEHAAELHAPIVVAALPKGSPGSRLELVRRKRARELPRRGSAGDHGCADPPDARRCRTRRSPGARSTTTQSSSLPSSQTRTAKSVLASRAIIGWCQTPGR